MSLVFCPVLAELYRTGVAIDAAGVKRAASGLSTPNNLLVIRALMMAMRPERTIEIGLAAGGSALAFERVTAISVTRHPASMWQSIRISGCRAISARRFSPEPALSCLPS
jgi:hypothetical protein